MKKRFGVLAVAMLGMLGVSGAAISASKSDLPSRVGTWKVNIAKSIPAQGEVQHSYTVVTRQADEILDFTFHTEKNGKPYQYSWKGPTDGTVLDVVPGMIRGSVLRLPDRNYQMTMWYDKTGMVEEQVCVPQVGGKQLNCWASFTYPGGATIFRKVVLDRIK